MPEPISTSYYRSSDICPTEPEPPATTDSSSPSASREPASGEAENPNKTPSAQLAEEHDRTEGQAADKRNYVYNVGITVTAEAGLGPLGSVGGALSFGMYADTANMELGFYQRGEKRELIGIYSGVSIEGGQTNSRDKFDGKSDMVFAEGGELGRVGVAFNATAGSISWGVGSGVAVGVAHTETNTEPTEPVSAWGPTPLRRGP